MIQKEFIFNQIVTEKDYNDLVSSGVCWEIAEWMPDTYVKYQQLRDEWNNAKITSSWRENW